MLARRLSPLTFLLGMILIASTGCSYWIEITQPEPIAHGSTMVMASDRMPVVIETVRLTQNGAVLSTPIEIERRLLSTIEDTQLFSQHFQSGYAQPLADQTHVRARLVINNTVEPHAGQAALKGIAIGASMFLLAPVIDLDYGYGSQMTLEVERWDGQIKRYSTWTMGTAHYNLFGANPQVIDELKGQVTDRCLTALLQQMVQDASFYVAGSTAPAESTIRSVSIMPKRAEPHPLPVSNPADPLLP